MNLRMTLGGDKGRKHHDSEHYTEGYNTGYNNAYEEMRRRTRGFAEPLHDDVESRRRRSRAEYDGHHMPTDGIRWTTENRQIGFMPHHEHDEVEDRRGRRGRAEYDESVHPMDALMDMVSDLKKGQEHIKQGMASSMKKLDPRMEGLLETATTVLDNPPSTWQAYMKREDYLGIAKMEGKELIAALEAHKPIKDIRKELSHTLAALMQLVMK